MSDGADGQRIKNGIKIKLYGMYRFSDTLKSQNVLGKNNVDAFKRKHSSLVRHALLRNACCRTRTLLHTCTHTQVFGKRQHDIKPG
jgi:hypothetical protein